MRLSITVTVLDPCNIMSLGKDPKFRHLAQWPQFENAKLHVMPRHQVNTPGKHKKLTRGHAKCLRVLGVSTDQKREQLKTYSVPQLNARHQHVDNACSRLRPVVHANGQINARQAGCSKRRPCLEKNKAHNKARNKAHNNKAPRCQALARTISGRSALELRGGAAWICLAPPCQALARLFYAPGGAKIKPLAWLGTTCRVTLFGTSFMFRGSNGFHVFYHSQSSHANCQSRRRTRGRSTAQNKSSPFVLMIETKFWLSIEKYYGKYNIIGICVHPVVRHTLQLSTQQFMHLRIDRCSLRLIVSYMTLLNMAVGQYSVLLVNISLCSDVHLPFFGTVGYNS